MVIRTPVSHKSSNGKVNVNAPRQRKLVPLRWYIVYTFLMHKISNPYTNKSSNVRIIFAIFFIRKDIYVGERRVLVISLTFFVYINFTYIRYCIMGMYFRRFTYECFTFTMIKFYTLARCA